MTDFVKLPCSQGKFFLISSEDLSLLEGRRWLAHRVTGTSHTGKIYFYGHKVGYRYKNSEGKIKKVWLHNLIMKPEAGFWVDHINGDPMDNRRENLRVVSHRQNSANKAKARGNYTSKFKGVSWFAQKGCWRAYLKRKLIGYSKCEMDAATMYNFAAFVELGETAFLNEVPQPFLDS